MRNAIRILRFLLEASARKEKMALLTITNVTGSSPRGLGTQMAVSETGAYLGSLSGGCIEAAIVGEAQKVIANNRAETLRFGQNSPFIDIRLPCGGSMDVLASPIFDIRVIQAAHDWITARRPATLILGKNGAIAWQPRHEAGHPAWQGEDFCMPLEPDMRLLIAGNGAEPLALARLALAYGADATVLSPNEAILAEAARNGANTQLLKRPHQTNHIYADHHTAVVTLFHDHDWEIDILLRVLQQQPFFIGAMGSRATHARRLRLLGEHGVPATALARIIGPIGLIGAARDPETLALSALSQVAAHYKERSLTHAHPITLAS